MSNDREGLAKAVSVEKFAECGPGLWWFVHHPEDFLIECGSEDKARRIAVEINAGRSTLDTLEQGGGET